MKDVWILEDDGRYSEPLEEAVRDAGFNPVSFGARNPFSKTFADLRDKSNVHAMILDNQLPYFEKEDPIGNPLRRNVGLMVIEELERIDALDGLRVALYTSDKMNSRIEEACDLGVQYFQKDFRCGPYWVREFLKP